MSFVIFRRYGTFPDAMVDFSLLKAHGYTPIFNNYHHASLDFFLMEALGGLIIMLPEQDIEEAKALIESSIPIPEEEYEPVKPDKKNRFKSAIFMVLHLFSPLWLFLFLPPLLIIVLAAVSLIFMVPVFIGAEANGKIAIVSIYALVVGWAALQSHAKYIALPRLKQARSQSGAS